jgi:hypothetical protein
LYIVIPLPSVGLAICCFVNILQSAIVDYFFQTFRMWRYLHQWRSGPNTSPRKALRTLNGHPMNRRMYIDHWVKLHANWAVGIAVKMRHGRRIFFKSAIQLFMQRNVSGQFSTASVKPAWLQTMYPTCIRTIYNIATTHTCKPQKHRIV